jgi:hypothetical protein
VDSSLQFRDEASSAAPDGQRAGAGCSGAGVAPSHGVCGSPSQQPSLNAQRGHCHVP